MTSFYDPTRLEQLFTKELELFVKTHPESKKLHDKAAELNTALDQLPQEPVKKQQMPMISRCSSIFNFTPSTAEF